MPGDTGGKTRTTRVRRRAVLQGIAVRKSRRRDPRALDWGWTLDDPRRAVHLTGLTLDQVENYLDTGDPGEA